MAEQKNPETTIHQEEEEEEQTPKKTSWPEVVGLSGDEAEKKIKQDMPTARTFLLPQGSFITYDYRLDRVRIFVDSTGKVADTPSIG